MYLPPLGAFSLILHVCACVHVCVHLCACVCKLWHNVEIPKSEKILMRSILILFPLTFGFFILFQGPVLDTFRKMKIIGE